MSRLSINILGWNSSHDDISECISRILAQDYDDFKLYFSDNGSTNGLLQFVAKKFANQPKLKIIDNEKNLGYAGGHNKFISESDSELVMVINPDAHLQPGFLKNIVVAFDDPAVAAATGKMLKPQPDSHGNRIIDGTGLVVSRSRIVRERGQHQIDSGQFDRATEVFGVSGSAAVFRKQALEQVRLFENEFFDPDFFAYFEDFDLAWRLRLMGWKAKYVPDAVVNHERAVSQSAAGWKKPVGFFRHYQKTNPKIRRWAWRNHMLTIIKNDFGWPFLRDLPWILSRQLAYFGYTLFFQPKVLGAIPDFFKLLPKILRKRKIIQNRKKVSAAAAAKWFA